MIARHPKRANQPCAPNARAMKLSAGAVATIGLVLALSGCSVTDGATAGPPGASEGPTASPSATPTTDEECSGEPFEVDIMYDITVDASGGVIVRAESNLPDGAQMNASFFVLNGYFGQDDGVLADGAVTFGPFSDKGTPLRGDYEMSITLPIARNQPESIQACIGAAGELMTGPLVHTEEITGDQVASVNVTVTLG